MTDEEREDLNTFKHDMLSTFIRLKDRGLILELIKEDIAENCIPMEVVGLFDGGEEMKISGVD